MPLRVAMQSWNLHEVLREKENAMERIRREVEAVRSVTPSLAHETEAGSNILVSPVVCREVETEAIRQPGEARNPVTPLLIDETDRALAQIRARLIEAAENDSKLGRAKRISRQLRQIAAPVLGAILR